MLKNKAFLSAFIIGLVAVFVAPSVSFAQYGYQGSSAYGYQGQTGGWGYNPYSNAGQYSYLSPFAQYGYGGGNYNPRQSTYTGNGYGYGAFGFQGRNNPYGSNSFNGYYPYTSQNCNYSFYGYQQQNCQNPNQNQNNGSGPQISNVSGPNSLSVGQSGTWTITTSAGAGNISASVSWGDQGQYGNAMAAAQQQVTSNNTFTHAYQQAGTYTIVFTVVDGYGRSNSAQATVVVGTGGGCTQNCNSDSLSANPTSGQAPLSVTFTRTITLNQTNSNPQLTISYGDGASGVMQYQACTMSPAGFTQTCTYTASHTYQQNGTFQAQSGPSSVTVTVGGGGNNGCQTQTCGLFANPTSGQAPLPVHFTGGVPGTSYTLDFGDGSQPVIAAVSVDCAPGYPDCAKDFVLAINQDHTYQAAGTYTARVTSGSNVSYTATVRVGGSGCPDCQSGNMSATPTSGSAPLTVNFTKSASGISQSTLNFGDGSTGAWQVQACTNSYPNPSCFYTVSHTYQQTGTFTATDSNGAGSVTVTVSGNGCTNCGTASFTANPASGNWPLNATFQATGLQSGQRYFVDFGDNSSSQWLTMSGSTGTVSHLYYVTGNFTATLVMVTCGGSAYYQGCYNPTQTVVSTANVSVH